MQACELSVRGFQALRSADFEFRPGLNVIIGRNNSGKTAAFRAVAAAAFNTPVGRDKIHRKATKSQVRLRLTSDEGQVTSVVWTREAKGSSLSSTYKIDGEKYEKIGRGALAEVERALGIKELQVARERLCLNFWEQESPPFLMDLSAAQTFEFLATSSQEGNLREALRLMDADAKGLDREATHLAGRRSQAVSELEVVDRALGALDGLEEVRPALDRVDAAEERLLLAKGLLMAQDNAVLRVEAGEVAVARCSRALSSRAERDRVRELLRRWRSVHEALTAYDKGSAIRAAHEQGLAQVKVVVKEDPARLQALVSRQETAQGLWVRIWQVRDRVQAAETDLGLVPDITPERLKDLERRCGLLASVKRVAVQLKTVGAAAEQRAERLRVLVAEGAELQQELATYKTCPLCGAKRGK